MEFNDSRVSHWDFTDLKQATMGNENKGQATTGFMAGLGDSYGKSGYMLFYERRKKKDLKILVADDQVEEQKAKGIDVQYDEEKKEHFKMSPYRSAADGELANQIYKKVAEDNQRFTFESDIYSTEFFNFIMTILQSVADGDCDLETKLNGMAIGTKVGFEILARMQVSPGMDKLTSVMVDTLKSQPEMSKIFLGRMCEFPASEVLWEIMFECQDKHTQQQLAKIIKYALCQLKEIEKEDAIAQTQVTVTRTFKDDQGVEQTVQEQKPKAICVRFLMHMVEQLAERAPKNWRKFDAFMDIFFGFMVNSANEVYADKDEYDAESDAYKTGIELYFIYNMI